MDKQLQPILRLVFSKLLLGLLLFETTFGSIFSQKRLSMWTDDRKVPYLYVFVKSV